MSDPRLTHVETNMRALIDRVDRCERALDLQLERLPSVTLGQLAPVPDYSSERAAEPDSEPDGIEPCSCDEALALRRRVHELQASLDQWMRLAWRETQRADDAEFKAFGYRFTNDAGGFVSVTDDTAAKP